MKHVPLRALLSFVVDNRGRTCPVADEGMPLIATNCVKNATLYPVFEKVRYVDRETYQNWFRAHPQPGDLIFVLKGSPGQVCLTPNPVNFCIAQDMVALRANPDAIYPPYLFAALRSTYVQEKIANLHVGSLIAHFKKGDFDRLDIPLPEIETQVAIGDLYLRICEKIEFNNKTAQTLEEMARALYRSWFVDFDPVRAKAEGREPAFMDAETAALFPDSFGDDGLPVGWRQERVGNLFSFQRGLSYKGQFLTDHGMPMINLGCFLGNGNYDSSKIKSYSGPIKERNVVNTGDLIVANTDMTQNRVILGSPHIVQKGPSLYSHHVYAGRVLHGKAPHWAQFLYFLFLQPEFRERAEGFATGTTVLFLPSDAIEAQEFPLPPLGIWQAFLVQVRPCLDHKINLEAESQSLASLRDTLLPKLMSGELRVGEAREQIEAA